MTTTLMPPEPVSSTEPAARMLTISANLLPPEIMESRHARRTRRIVLSAVAAVAILLGGWYGLASHQTSLARGDLGNAQSDVERLVQQQKPYAELIRTQNESRAIDARLAALLANDLRWAQLLSSLRGAAPQGVQLIGVTGGVAPAKAGTAATPQAGTPRLPDTSGQKVVGTLTLNGTAPSKETVAEYIDALAKVQGLGNPMLERVSEEGKAASFTLRVDITGLALGGRYTTGTASKGR
ncbi:hypothetical protein HC028_22310 [Planosporangium flavigriseum]|uniref:Fimbrial assembly protein (PilN) n=1 Tax=Planosporangium flavigriseum TaxID=373681 RepID=A0A8J3PNM1_9ACTN|nr:PilN domain-containing protein [Planosporangium flavigriseum]NJC67212.1 hypothetical protein [Planosporangium flavigriseum]GIG76142.1 hypothetical protein Pfl04_45460 [Planosporangium flavigriseum]